MTASALSELLQQTTALRALAGALVGEAAADDVLQETAVQALSAPPARPGPAGGWLVAVVRNLARKQHRAERTRARHEALAAREPVAAPDQSAEDADTLRRLTEVLTALPEPYRGTILARFLRGQTPTEIAAATGTPVRTVKTRLQRGLALLRRQLGERDDDWRARLVAAFALEPAAAGSALLSTGTIMKLLLLTVALLPVGWWLLPDQGGVLGTAPDNAPVTLGAPVSSPLLAASADGTASVTVADPGAQVAGPAAAVTPPTARPTAPGPFAQLDLAGPAAWRDAFRPTNLGGMFASEVGERLGRSLLAPLERVWQQWDGRGDGFPAARDRMLDYAGHIRVLWLMEPGGEGARDRAFGVMALDMDGRTDMSALANDLARAMRGMLPGEPHEQSVGEFALQLLGESDGDVVTLPLLVEGNLVAFFGEAATLGEDVPRCLQALAAAGPPARAPLAFHVDLAQLRLLGETAEEPGLRLVFGLDSLRSFGAVVRPNGPHAELELEVVFDEGERGVFAGLLPAVGALPKLLGRLPMAATPWLTVPFRPDEILRVVLEVAALESREEGGVEAMREKMHEELGLYLDTELLDHLGGEVMVLGDLWQPEDPDAFREGGDPPLGACVAFSLRDAAAFEAGFEKLLEHLKGAVRRFETREVNGVEICRVGTAFTTGIHMAVGQGLFAIAFGEEGTAQLEALVTAQPGPGQPPLPAPVQRVRHLVPAGWNGVGLADLSALFGGQITLAMELLEDSLPPPMRPDLSPDETQEWLDQLLPLVVEHQLDKLVTMTGYQDGVWRLRLLW